MEGRMNIRKHVSLNLDVRGLGQSATIAINDRCHSLRQNGKMVYRLGLGQSPFPVPRRVVKALKLYAREKDYLPAAGLPHLRDAVAEFHRQQDGIEAHRDNILIGPGSKELMFILQLVYYGELVVPTPCWVSYVPQANILSRKISLVDTKAEDRWMVTAQMLEKHCQSEHDDFRPRILVLNYPSNPVGATYTEQELKDLAEVARKYQVILLSDEIYGQLNHRGKHISVARYYPEGTIISSGLSKWCGAGGWRLGTFTFPRELDWLLESMTAVASETFTSVSAPIQFAAVQAFKGGRSIERYLCHARRILKSLGNHCADLLRSADVNVSQPQGGFYLFADFSSLKEKLASKGVYDSATMCEKLLSETGVAILPGVAFERPLTELTARMAYVDFDGARAMTVSETIPLDQELPESFIESNCYNVVRAVDAVVEWIKN